MHCGVVSDLDLNHLIVRGLNANFQLFHARDRKPTVFMSFARLIEPHVKKGY